MNLKRLFMIAGVTMIMTGCGSQERNVEKSTETIAQTEVQSPVQEETAEETGEKTAEEEAEEIAKETSEKTAEEAVPKSNTVKQEDEEKETQRAETVSADDNFSADMEAVAKFAGNLKAVVMQKDLVALADLTAYPMYLNFPDGGKSIENKDALVVLGSDKVFTEELVDSVRQADEMNLSPSRAGFVLDKESGAPNIIFGLQNGKLAVSAINY